MQQSESPFWATCTDIGWAVVGLVITISAVGYMVKRFRRSPMLVVVDLSSEPPEPPKPPKPKKK